MTFNDYFNLIIEFILDPIISALTNLEVPLTNEIQIGFGSISWFNFTLEQLLGLIVSVTVWFVLFRLTWKFLLWIFSPLRPKGARKK